MTIRNSLRILALAIGAYCVAVSNVGLASEPTPVPPSLEIEVLDPGVDPRGNPAVLFGEARNVACCRDDNISIEIPPAVIVHRFYYTGDRTFQGPMLPGGPTIIVINHPRTGERLYIEATMLPGSPEVTYRPRKVIYDYGKESLIIEFSSKSAKVVFERHEALVTHAARATAAVAKSGCKVTKDLTKPVRDVGKYAATRADGLLEMLPVKRLLFPRPEDVALDARSAEVRKAAGKSAKLNLDFPTVR